jgi:hypothetical protein
LTVSRAARQFAVQHADSKAEEGIDG